MTTCHFCNRETSAPEILSLRMCLQCGARSGDPLQKVAQRLSFSLGWADTRLAYARFRQKYFGMAASDVRFLIPRTTKPIRPTLRPIPVDFIWQPDPDDSHPPLRPDDIPNPPPGNASDRVRLR